ncbi:MAG: deoxyribose-phosphate aldolase [Ginsengibacter sp.]
MKDIKIIDNLAAYIDHTLLKPTATLGNIEQLCKEAIDYKFTAVCIPPIFIKKTKELLQNSPVKTATVIGFPFGYSAIEAKVAEVILSLVDGADELDMVINITALKNDDWQYLANEINTILPIIQGKQKVIKVIIETGILTNDEIIKCCNLYSVAGVDYIKTSTGYAERGASVEAVKLIRENCGKHIKIKASGGIKTYDFAIKLIKAGANRIGCSSSVNIINESNAAKLG